MPTMYEFLKLSSRTKADREIALNVLIGKGGKFMDSATVTLQRHGDALRVIAHPPNEWVAEAICERQVTEASFVIPPVKLGALVSIEAGNLTITLFIRDIKSLAGLLLRDDELMNRSDMIKLIYLLDGE